MAGRRKKTVSMVSPAGFVVNSERRVGARFCGRCFWAKQGPRIENQAEQFHGGNLPKTRKTRR